MERFNKDGESAEERPHSFDTDRRPREKPKDGESAEKRPHSVDTDRRPRKKPTDHVRRNNSAEDPRGKIHEV